MSEASNRRTLSLRSLPQRAPDEIVREAIGRRTCVTATYNRTEIRMAPHVLYTRHDELFVDGATLERDGNPPREIKIGTFKLAGLGSVAATRVPFEPFSGFEPGDAKYDGVTVATLQRQDDAA